MILILINIEWKLIKYATKKYFTKSIKTIIKLKINDIIKERGIINILKIRLKISILLLKHQPVKITLIIIWKTLINNNKIDKT